MRSKASQREGPARSRPIDPLSWQRDDFGNASRRRALPARSRPSRWASRRARGKPPRWTGRAS
eukprot:5163427-Pleurochrysis_carterae.AAC.2